MASHTQNYSFFKAGLDTAADIELIEQNWDLLDNILKSTPGQLPPTLTAAAESDTSASSASWTGTGYFCNDTGKYVANPFYFPSVKGYYRFCLRPDTASYKECMMWTPYYICDGYRHEFFYSPVRGLYETLIPPTDATAQEIVDSIVWEFTPPTLLKYGKLSNAINFTLEDDGENINSYSINSEMYIRDSSGNITLDDGHACFALAAEFASQYDIDTNLCALLHLISDVKAGGEVDVTAAILIQQIAVCLSATLPIETIDSFNA